MQVPLRSDFHNMDDIPAGLEDLVRDKARELEHAHRNITACKVAVERRHHRRHSRDHFHVRISMHIPGAVIAVDQASEKHLGHDDLELLDEVATCDASAQEGERHDREGTGL